MSAPRVPRPYLGAESRLPAGTLPGQHVADVPEDGEVTVFLVGMRVHRWRSVRHWFPAFVAMPRMLRELAAHPEDGLLHATTLRSGRTFLVLQYWRSAEDLGRYARNAERLHAPAWTAFNRAAAAAGAVGLFHETYVVPASEVETRYANMTPFGLGLAFGARNRADHLRRTTAETRLDVTETEYVEA